MIFQQIDLKDQFAFLAECGSDATLSVYIPQNYFDDAAMETVKPGILICPGGGYRFVSKREAEPVAMKFLQDGYRVFVLHYSVAPKRFPTALQEVAAAVEVIHQNAQEWYCDADRLAIVGFSAGGHLACHYSNCYDDGCVRQAIPESKPVAAAVLCYPVITGDEKYGHRGSIVNLSGHEQPTDADIAAFSLEKLVSEKTPPTFLWHTRTDATVPVMNTLLYAQALAEKGVDFSVHIYPKGRHGLSTVDALVNKSLDEESALAVAWVDEARKWLKITL